MLQPVYKIVWEFLQNLDIELNTSQQIPFWIPIEKKIKIYLAFKFIHKCS